MAAAISTADMMFSLPSVRGLPIGSWLPVNITGLQRLSSMKLIADALYAMVSVPCRITNPSYFSYFSWMSLASACQSEGSTLDESMSGEKV